MSPRAPDPGALDVLRRVRGAGSLAEVGRAAEQCRACPDLADSRSSVVVGDFPPVARLMLVGEAPGAHEDIAGRPFVGKAGQLLDRMLADAGLDRTEVAVANVLKCRPPGNRTPSAVEANRCRGWLDRQVELVDPEVVVTLGGAALAWALGRGALLRDARRHVHDWNGRRLLATYHPSAALRFGPAGAPMAALREDLRRAAELLCGK